jgi:hypothetical protein
MSDTTSNANSTPDMNNSHKIRVNIKKKDTNNSDLSEHVHSVSTVIPVPEIKINTKRTNTLLLNRLDQLEKENPNLFHIETNGIVSNEEIADFFSKYRP